MSTFDDRERAFEKKFAHDAEMTFKAEARRNRMLAEWLGKKIGMSDEEAKDYGVVLIGTDLKEAGDDDVIQKVLADAKAKSVTLDEAELRAKSAELLSTAKVQLMEESEPGDY